MHKLLIKAFKILREYGELTFSTLDSSEFPSLL